MKEEVFLVTLLSILFLAVAVSFDSLAMGITYGLNRIRVPFWSKVVLSIVSGISLLVSMIVGGILREFIHPAIATVIGGIIFVLLGLYQIWSSYRPAQPRILLNLRIPLFGLIIQVLQEPLLADRDQSQTISGHEAFLLGTALALDAIAAGFAASLLRLPLLGATSSVLVASFLFMSLGLELGTNAASSPLSKPFLRWLPGMVILCLGLVKIIAG